MCLELTIDYNNKENPVVYRATHFIGEKKVVIIVILRVANVPDF